MAAKSVLIAGAGIAGPTLAYWLRERGYAPTLVERAPQLRSGGYIIDFWGLGYDIAERMGLLPAIKREGYLVQGAALRRRARPPRRRLRCGRVPRAHRTGAMSACRAASSPR